MLLQGKKIQVTKRGDEVDVIAIAADFTAPFMHFEQAAHSELLDHLGPNALKYQETKMIRTYKEKLQDSYLSIKKKTVETKDKIRDMFTDKKVE